MMRGTNYSMLSSSGDLSVASTADEDPAGSSMHCPSKCGDVLNADEMEPCHLHHPSPTKSRYQRSCAPSLSPVRDNSGDLSVGECCNVQISPSEALARLNDMDAAIRASGLQHRLRRSEGRSEPPAQGKRKGAQITADALEKLRAHTSRESSLRTLDTSHWASHSYGRSLRLALMTYQDVPVPEAPQGPKRRNSGQWRDRGIDPQAGKPQAAKRVDPQAGKLQAVKRSSTSPATRRKSSPQTAMRRVSPQVSTRDREIDGLKNVATAGRYPAVRDQVVPALLQAGLIVLMTIAALGLLVGYVMVFESFHAC